MCTSSFSIVPLSYACWCAVSLVYFTVNDGTAGSARHKNAVLAVIAAMPHPLSLTAFDLAVFRWFCDVHRPPRRVRELGDGGSHLDVRAM